MPAVSVNQAIASRIARAAKKGKIPKSQLRGASKQMAESMTTDQLGDFAKTKTKGLPTRKKAEALIDAYAEGVFQKCAELNLEFEQALEVWNELAAKEPAAVVA